MTAQSRTFRIFVSSTFSDLKEERNALQERVFPRLRELCAEHGARLQAIDLRWGVSEEASLDQQTMNICLGEIERSQQVTPRPNFVVLLGDRYGWCPPPPQIPAAEFARILATLHDPGDLDFLLAWYLRDDNAVPPEYYLRPRAGELAVHENWEPVERRLQRTLEGGARGLGLPPESLAKYTTSATEQEIIKGAMQVDDAEDHVFCFFRSIEGLPEDQCAREYVDLDQGGKWDANAATRLRDLKQRLDDMLPGNVHHYRARWLGEGITLDHLDQLCEDVTQCLSSVILDQLTRPISAPLPTEGAFHIVPHEALDEEGLAHHRFAEERLEIFVGRSHSLGTIKRYIRSTERTVLGVVGEGGTGKSSLMAKAIEQAHRDQPTAQVIYRFIGTTPGSSGVQGLLEGLCRELGRRYGSADDPVPGDYHELVTEFTTRLGQATAARPLILFLDALDQLSGTRSLAWVPDPLPEQVRVIVSTRPGDGQRSLEQRQAQMITLGALSANEGDELLGRWLEAAHRTLQEPQRLAVLEKFNRSQGRPLYLKLAFEEARRWKSGSGEPPEQLALGIPGIIERNLLDRLAREDNHGEVLVSHVLGYLAASRYGLAEDELLDLVARDRQVYAWFLRSVYHYPRDILAAAQDFLRSREPLSSDKDWASDQDEAAAAQAWLDEVRTRDTELDEFLAEVLAKPGGPRLPIVLWSRLSFNLAPYMTERLVDGSSLLSFYHRELGDVSQTAFLADDGAKAYHGKLADYFCFKADPAGDRSWTGGDIHGLSELPYHLTTAARHQEAYQTLTDFKFLEHKAEKVGILVSQDREGNPIKNSTGLLQIQEDIERLRGVTGGEVQDLSGEQSTILQSFSRALEREAHVLTQHPDLLWQQLYNRLQWEEEEVKQVLAPELAQRSAPGARPWLRLATPYRESAALQRIFSGHSDGVFASAVAPDSSFVVSGGVDQTLRLWSLADGQELRVLSGHSKGVTACAVSPDGTRIVSASYDETLRLWNSQTGELIKILRGHTGPVTACAFFPGGARLASASWDCTVKIWDLERGLEINSLRGHLGWVSTCAVSLDGSFVVSGSWDATLRIWNPESGTELQTLRGHNDRVYGCAVAPDGSWIVSASMDGTLRIWDVADGQSLRTLRGHSDEVHDCAISPDGSFIVSASVDHTLRLWDPFSGEEVDILEGHTRDVASCSVSPDGRWIVSASTDHSLRVWSANRSKALLERKGHVGRVNACAFSADGSVVISGSDDRTLRIWDSSTGEEQQTLKGHRARVWDCAVTSDGSCVISASVDTTLRVWDPITGDPIIEKLLRILKGHAHEVLACRLSPDESLVVSGSADKTLRLWDLQTGQVIRKLTGHTSDVTACAFTPDGLMVVSASADETLRLWDLASGRSIRQFVGHTDCVWACDISPDGSFLASAGGDKTIRLWDLGTGEERLTLRGHSNEIWGCAVSPDGRYILSASWDNSIRVWSAVTGQELTALALHGVLQCIAMHPGGKRIACGDAAGALHLIQLVGLELASPIVSAVKRGEESIIYCPSCFQVHPLQQEWLGREVACPAFNCGSRMRVNPFVADSATVGKR